MTFKIVLGVFLPFFNQNICIFTSQLAVVLILLLPLAGASADDGGFIRQVTDGRSRAGAGPGLLPEAQFAAFVRRHGRRYSGPEE